MSESRYVVRPKADQDLDDQAYYYATVANPSLVIDSFSRPTPSLFSPHGPTWDGTFVFGTTVQ